MSQPYRSNDKPNAHGIEQVLATVATSSIKCMNCQSEYTRPGSTFVNDLLYPSIVCPSLALSYRILRTWLTIHSEGSRAKRKVTKNILLTGAKEQC